MEEVYKTKKTGFLIALYKNGFVLIMKLYRRLIAYERKESPFVCGQPRTEHFIT